MHPIAFHHGGNRIEPNLPPNGQHPLHQRLQGRAENPAAGVWARVLLRAGYSANADLVIREKTDILLIPERLVLFEEDGAKTFVEVPGVGEDPEPRRVEVRVGLSDGLQIEVLEGLEEGDVIVQRPPRDILS